jgi:hypothetical protein
MSFLSDLVIQGRVKNRGDLRRVYRSLVKRYHPDALASRGVSDSRAADIEGGGIDFAALREELTASEKLLAEMALRPRENVGDEAAASLVAFNGQLLASELRDLVARSFPVNHRAFERNKAYREGIARISVQLDLLFGESGSFKKIDDEARLAWKDDFTIRYHINQVLWNGLDWRLFGYSWMRDAALRDYELAGEALRQLRLSRLDRLLSWIVDAELPLSSDARTGTSRR